MDKIIIAAVTAVLEQANANLASEGLDTKLSWTGDVAYLGRRFWISTVDDTPMPLHGWCSDDGLFYETLAEVEQHQD